MAISDPPYNVDYGNHGGAPKGGKKRTIQNDDLGEGFYEFQVSACRDLISDTDGAVYICMSSPELHTLQRAFCVAGGHWSTFVVWAKDTFTLGRYDYQRQYEPILYGWREGTKHYWLGDRDQGDVWSIEKPLSNPLHPTMKPLSLFERAIENSSRPSRTATWNLGPSSQPGTRSRNTVPKWWLERMGRCDTSCPTAGSSRAYRQLVPLSRTRLATGGHFGVWRLKR